MWGGCGQTIQHGVFSLEERKQMNVIREETGWDTPQSTKKWVDFFAKFMFWNALPTVGEGIGKALPKLKGKSSPESFSQKHP